MYFYHEGYHETYHADAALEDLRPRDRYGEDLTYEPIRIPAILHWVVIMSVALCIIFTAIEVLS